MALEDKQTLLRNVESKISSILTVASAAEVIKIVSTELAKYNIEYTGCGTANSDNYIKAFLDAKRIEGRSDKTIAHYRYMLQRLADSVGVPVGEITVYHLRSFLMAEKERGISDRTTEGMRCVFSSFFGWLYKESLIESNPCMNIGKIKYLKKIRYPFTDAEIEMLKEQCKTDRDKALICFLLATGCRISEVCNLNISDVCFQTLECKVIGKGNKERTVFLDDISSMQLQRYLSGRTDDSVALFIGKGTDRITPEGVRARLQTISEKAGVKNVHPHRFRRTLATNLIDRGMPIQEVASILGHENINTTMTYVFVNKNNVKNAYRKFA